MFYPAYIHSDSDGSASGFFPDVPDVFLRGISTMTLFRMHVMRSRRTSKRCLKWMKHCLSRVVSKCTLKINLTTSQAGNGCWWILI